MTITGKWEAFIGTNIGTTATAEVTATALRPCVKNGAVHGLASIDKVLIKYVEHGWFRGMAEITLEQLSLHPDAPAPFWTKCGEIWDGGDGVNWFDQVHASPGPPRSRSATRDGLAPPNAKRPRREGGSQPLR